MKQMDLTKQRAKPKPDLRLLDPNDPLNVEMNPERKDHPEYIQGWNKYKHKQGAKY